MLLFLNIGLDVETILVFSVEFDVAENQLLVLEVLLEFEFWHVFELELVNERLDIELAVHLFFGNFERAVLFDFKHGFFQKQQEVELGGVENLYRIDF